MLMLSIFAALATVIVEPISSRPSPLSLAVEAPGPEGPLRGTLTGSTGAAQPVVLIIPGSGLVDRDGNSPAGIKAATYRLLAEGLATHGIASVRIDKRGMFASAGAVSDANASTIADYATDARVWVDIIRKRTGARCIWLLGHSEGALVALKTAAAFPRHLCGTILVAAAGRPLGQVLRDQFRANPANEPILEDALTAIASLEAGKQIDSGKLPAPLQQIFDPAVQDFLISTFAIDPAQLIAEVNLPVLIVQGERDIQVSTGDARRLAKAQAAARLALLPDTNHVLKTVSSDELGENVASYADPHAPLADQVVPIIASFISSSRNGTGK